MFVMLKYNIRISSKEKCIKIKKRFISSFVKKAFIKLMYYFIIEYLILAHNYFICLTAFNDI